MTPLCLSVPYAGNASLAGFIFACFLSSHVGTSSPASSSCWKGCGRVCPQSKPTPGGGEAPPITHTCVRQSPCSVGTPDTPVPGGTMQSGGVPLVHFCSRGLCFRSRAPQIRKRTQQRGPPTGQGGEKNTDEPRVQHGAAFPQAQGTSISSKGKQGPSGDCGQPAGPGKDAHRPQPPGKRKPEPGREGPPPPAGRQQSHKPTRRRQPSS